MAIKPGQSLYSEAVIGFEERLARAGREMEESEDGQIGNASLTYTCLCKRGSNEVTWAQGSAFRRK